VVPSRPCPPPRRVRGRRAVLHGATACGRQGAGQAAVWAPSAAWELGELAEVSIRDARARWRARAFRRPPIRSTVALAVLRDRGFVRLLFVLSPGCRAEGMRQ